MATLLYARSNPLDIQLRVIQGDKQQPNAEPRSLGFADHGDGTIARKGCFDGKTGLT